MMNDDVNLGYSALCIKSRFIRNTTNVTIIELFNIINMVDVIVNTIPNPFLKTSVNQIHLHVVVVLGIRYQLFEVGISHLLVTTEQ